MKKCLLCVLLAALWALLGVGAMAEEPIALTDVQTGQGVSFCVQAEEDGGFVLAGLYDGGQLSELVAEPFTNGMQLSLDTAGADASIKVMLWNGGTEKMSSNPAELTLKDGVVQLSENTVSAVVAQMTDEEKATLVTGTGLPAWLPHAAGANAGFPKYGIPVMTMADGPAGIRIEPQGGKCYGVAYPSGTNLASAWDPALAEEVGAAIGRDCKAYGVEIILGPGMNIQRDVLGGRNFEYFSEDPFVTGAVGTAYINGVQSEGVGVSAKHFAGNNQETNRGAVNSKISERALREIYLAGFEAAVKDAEPWTLMTSYNKLNGLFNSVNKDLLTGILREEWGYNAGFVMSDWDASGSKVEMVKAQNDWNAPGHPELGNITEVLTAIQNGTITKEEIDRCCENILKVVAKSQAMTKGEPSWQIDFEREAEISRRAAADGIVLLKNEGALPVQTDKTLALFGNAQKHTMKMGTGAGDVNVKDQINIVDGLSTVYELNKAMKAKYADCQANELNFNIDENPKDDPVELEVTEAEAEAAAAESDVAVICLNRITREGKDHRPGVGDYQLNQTEKDMIDRVSAAFHAQGKKVVAVLNVGNPMDVASWQDKVDALVYMGLCGQEGGYALADIFSGKVNPSAKLTATWPVSYQSVPSRGYFPGNADSVEYYEDIYVGYRYYETFDVETAYPFGYGLSYTTFGYSDFTVDSTTYDGELQASVTVTNTGSVAGREVVQLYVTKPDGKLEQPKYALVGFAKTGLLAPGESETVTITVTDRQMRSYNEKTAAWVIEAGEYILSAAASVEDIRATRTVTVPAEILVEQVTNKCVPEPFAVLTKAGFDPAAKKENLALGKPATADAVEASYVAENAVDGDFTTRWSGVYNGAPGATTYNLLVDLEQPYHIGRIAIRWEIRNCPYSISVADSADGPFTQVAEGPAGILNTDDAVDVTARYVKVTVQANVWASIYELEVYEK